MAGEANAASQMDTLEALPVTTFPFALVLVELLCNDSNLFRMKLH